MFGITGDWHISNSLSKMEIIKNYQLETLRTMLHSMKKHKVKIVILVGDVFDAPVISASYYKELLELLNQYNFKYIFVLGNHEEYSIEYNALQLLELFGHKVITKPQKYKGFYIVPYSKNIKLPNTDRIILGHFDVNGAILDNGFKMKCKIPNNKNMILGHIHKHQIINQVKYVGSPYQVNFGDKQKNKQWIYVDKNYDVSAVSFKPSYMLKNIKLKDNNISHIKDMSRIFYKIQYTNHVDAGTLRILQKNSNVLQLEPYTKKTIRETELSITKEDTDISEEFIKKTILRYLKEYGLTNKQIKKAINVLESI